MGFQQFRSRGRPPLETFDSVMKTQAEFWGSWRERFSALRNVPTVLRFVWESGRAVVILGLVSRVIASLLPPALFWVSKLIIDTIYKILTAHQPIGTRLWWLVALEFGLASLAAVLVRLINFCDVVLADKYSRHISTKIMEHASRLDLTSFEDPSFYDRMERARVQGTDRIVLIQATGLLIQQLVTTVSLAAGILFFSPWILIALVACVVVVAACNSRRRLRPARKGERPPAPVRAASDVHGNADWLEMGEVRKLFPGPHPAYGGVVVGEAYRDLGMPVRAPCRRT